MFLIDYLKNNGNILPLDSECPFYKRADIVSRIGNAVCINAQNVADYFRDRDMSERYDWTLKDIPFARPPFPICWIEYLEPFDSNGLKFLKALRPDIQQFGTSYHGQLFMAGDGKHKRNSVLSLTFKASKDNRNKIISMTYLATIYFEMDKNGALLDLLENTQWYNFWRRKSSIPYRIYDLDKTIARNANVFERSRMLHGSTPEQEYESYRHSIELHWLSCLLTFSFCNCKNVKTSIVREGNLGSGPFGDKTPITRIYTLIIDPARKILSSNNGGSEQLSQKALHICRGHFKDFSHGTGLFGKHRGIYWWPMQTRGDRAYGEVKKDYRVLPLKD